MYSIVTFDTNLSFYQRNFTKLWKWSDFWGFQSLEFENIKDKNDQIFIFGSNR